LASQKNNFQPSAKQKTQIKRQEEEKDQSLVPPKNSLPNSAKKQSNPHGVHYTTNPS
jgi:hypothetical protein